MSFTSSKTVALNKARSFVLPLTSFFEVLSCATLGSPSPRPVGILDIEPPALTFEMEAEGETESVACLAGEALKLRTEPW
jgi:hypothetical protein